MKITIKLLSDLCTASGETYNSLVDTDVVYDSYGLPYIPAKRIKGCIREAALEMRDFGLIDEETFTALFGKEGNTASGFTLSNAYLKGYDEIRKALAAFVDKEFVSRQAVLDVYTSMRTQTAVDLESGVADKNSLRTIRVINREIIFEAECNVKNEAQVEKLKQAVSLVKHMGQSRSRGLGLVEMRLEGENAAGYSHVRVDKSKLYEKNKLRYTITLKSAMICKSAQGNQAVTQDYIAGSKVLGMIAGALGKDKYQDLMFSDELIVTNAYIAHNGSRCMVAPCSLQKEKDQPWVNGEMEILDMRFDSKDANGKQMTSAGITYMGTDGRKVDVSTEISYHHKRPEDKSIGRATGDDGSSFYQLCSISADQSFTGFIYANRTQAEQILDACGKLGEVRMGYGKSAEFGAVDFVIDRVESTDMKSENVNKAAVTLASDMILYNEAGFLSTELAVLKRYLNESLGVGDIEIKSPFLAFTTIGGYNVTWKARKPIFKAFAKGTSFLIESKSGFDINRLNRTFIGERVSEGFGEVIATKCASATEVTVKKLGETTPQNADTYGTTEIIQALLQIEFDRRMTKRIMELLNEKKEPYKRQTAGFNAAVSKLRAMYKNEKSYEDMKSQVDGIESDAKKGLCHNLLKLVNPTELKKQIADKFKEEYGIPFSLKKDDSELFKDVYRIYISELKHFAKTLDGEVAANGK